MSDRIDKAKLKAYIAEELENVAGLKKQLTDADIEKLELEFTKTEIHQTLLEMENFAQLMTMEAHLDSRKLSQQQSQLLNLLTALFHIGTNNN